MKTQLPTTTNRNQAFTLIELLIAITIVAILSVIAYSIFANIQKGSRDSVRRIEIDTLAKNIESSFDPGLRTYTYTKAMYDADYSSSFPRDPLLGATDAQTYCLSIGSSSTAPGATVLTDWAATNPCPTAPSGGGTYLIFNDKSLKPSADNLGTNTNTTAACTAGTCTVATAAPSWELCSKLEAISNVYCRFSLQ